MKSCPFLVAALSFVWLSTPVFSQEDEAEATQASQEQPEAFDLDAFVQEYRMLLIQQKVDEAEQKFKDALANNPDSAELKSLHTMAYSFLRRAGRNEEAFEHLKAATDHQMEMAAEQGRGSENFSRHLTVLVDFAATLGGAERALSLLDEFEKRAKEMDGALQELVNSVETQRAIQLAKAGRTDEAKAIIDRQVAAAETKLQENPSDVDAILAKASALSNRVHLEYATKDGDANKAWSYVLEFLSATAKEHADSQEVVRRFATEHMSRAAQLARSEPDQAEALLKRIEDFSTEIRGADGNADDEAAAGAEVLALYQSSIGQLREQIEESRKMLALIGTPAAYPENVDGWANGEPLTPESLKGKVVLLDFFAVWCGPCIATFPHLREWHDEYADKGLQIIAVTNYEEYGWDEEAGGPKEERGIEPEAERAAMENFAKHHELRHPIAFVTDRALREHYVVSGIPHAVVIDRQGKVRLFRVGSGDANAADLKKAIEESLAEPPPAG